MSGQWKPGDVAYYDGTWSGRVFFALGGWIDQGDIVRNDMQPKNLRPLVVIDPEDREQVERLFQKWWDNAVGAESGTERMRHALREFANPTRPAEPTDPRARVTDRRENIWRLLADGAWVCTSGPDSGEYLAWSRLAAERGPVEIEVVLP